MGIGSCPWDVLRSHQSHQWHITIWNRWRFMDGFAALGLGYNLQVASSMVLMVGSWCCSISYQSLGNPQPLTIGDVLMCHHLRSDPSLNFLQQAANCLKSGFFPSRLYNPIQNKSHSQGLLSPCNHNCRQSRIIVIYKDSTDHGVRMTDYSFQKTHQRDNSYSVDSSLRLKDYGSPHMTLLPQLQIYACQFM